MADEAHRQVPERAVPDPGIATILFPKWRSALARFSRSERASAPLKLLLLVGVGAGFWSAVYTVALRVLRYMKAAPEIGSFLPG